jgi:hypothetical protein
MSPPVVTTSDDVGHSSESNIDAGIYSDEQEGLIAPEEEEDYPEEESQGKPKPMVDKQLGKNDHIIVKDNDVFIKMNDDEAEQNLNDMNIVI